MASNSLALAAGGAGNFSLIGGSVADGAGTANFVDYLTPNGNGTLRLDSRPVLLNRTLARSHVGFTATYPTSLTFLMRVAPVASTTYDANTRLFDLELAFNDARLTLVLRGDAVSNNVRLANFENGGADINAQLDMSLPHIYQIAVTMTGAYTGTVAIYADGNATPIIGPLATTNMKLNYLSDRNYVQFGDNRDVSFRSDLDWMIWTHDGAYTPAQIQGKLPSGLGITTGY